MKQIPVLKTSKLKKDRLVIAYTFVDDEDYETYSCVKWYFKDGYAVNRKEKRVRYLHRLILGEKKGTEIDHINRNKLDNQRCNLRLATKKINAENRGLQSNNTSGYRGVVWDKGRNLWQARVKHNMKGILIGRYPTKEEAHIAVKQKRRELGFHRVEDYE